MHRVLALVDVVTMDVAVENCHVLIRSEDIENIIAVSCEPLPVGAQIEQWTMCKDNNRRRVGITGDVAFEPFNLLCAHGRLSR